jgi:response regulator RpfG family c-di-GMP phosphodiesterase
MRKPYLAYLARPAPSMLFRGVQTAFVMKGTASMSADKGRPPVVAVLNSNDDTVEMLRMMVEVEGMLAVSAHLDAIKRGELDFGNFLREHDPKVIIFDVAPPYDRTWLLFRHLRAIDAAKGRTFVLTTTNKQRLEEIAHPDHEVYEIVGKPYDMAVIVNAVKKALGI